MPEVGEFVLATVNEITTYGVYVSLDEYNNMKGFLHRSEVATGRIRRIGRFIRVGQKDVLKVIRVNRERREVNLSLKQISQQDKKSKLMDVKQSDKAIKVIESAKQDLNLAESESDNFQLIIEEKFGNVYKALEELALNGINVFIELGLPHTYCEYLEKAAKEKISLPKVTVSGTMEISSSLPNGIEIVKEALSASEKEQTSITKISLIYLCAPKYRLSIESTNYKDAEKTMKNVVDIIQNKMKKHGSFQFLRDKK